MGAMQIGVRDRNSGYTLLELLVTVSVLAIAVAAAGPAVSGFVETNRVAARVNDLVSSLNFARSEAVTRGQPVSACPANASRTACAGTTDWSAGWLVFTDASGIAGSVDGVDEILRVIKPLTTGERLSSVATRDVRYLPTGFLAAAAGPFTLSTRSCSGEHARRIAITPQGRPQVSPVSC
jgi:type IV fimbrial biogenesis protein FimT